MASIQGIYVALFGRPADPAGLAYFNEATNNGANLDAIGDLAKTDEYQSRFANMTNEEIVNSIYKSLFERDGEKAGIDFYVGELAAGRLNINNIAIAILDGAKNDDLTTVNAKIAAADIFTSHLDLNAEIEAYRGTFAAQVGREFLDTITKDHLGTPGEADTAILRLFPDQGQQPGTGGGSSGGSSATFVIHHEGSSITKFDGSATGDITLGQKSDGSAPVSMAIASESKSYGTILTGERGNLHIKATFDPSGTTVDATHGVHIESLDSLKPTDSLKLTDDLHVSLSAATADGHAISGAGSVWVSGSEEDQTMITVSATGGNHIEGGLGADTINITGATGSDTIEVRGTDSESIDAVHEAEDTLH
ncbi:MAG: DUF4214 domain-containing protein, partial [Rhizobiales bacterium]|nr:DUF4214 domain-containing protein [Hyphomicrobiales bacterium]